MEQTRRVRAVTYAFGQRLRHVRQATGLSAATCAAAMGWNHSATWLHYERGDNLPSCITVWRMAALLGCATDELRPDNIDLPLRAKRWICPPNGCGLMAREKQALCWLGLKVPGFWQGAEWRLEELLKQVGRTGREGKTLRREQLRCRVRRLESGRHIIYRGSGNFSLARHLWRT